MNSVLVVYHSQGGHTARIARRIWETVIAEGNQADMMSDLIIIGSPVIYGKYPKVFMNFVDKYKTVLNSKTHSFFNVSLMARSALKATPEANHYMQKFLKKSPWSPRDVKCIAGKVDYPNWSLMDKKIIQIIMTMVKGPTDPNTVIDYTDWEDVKSYARHCLTLI